MNAKKAAAIAASAYNVCGPKQGAAATPTTISNFDRSLVANCLAEYVTAHDGDLFTREEIREVRDSFLA